MFFHIWVFLSIVMQLMASNSTEYSKLQAENTQSKNMLLTSFLCDDDLQKALIYKMDLMETLIQNVKVKVDNLIMRNIKQYEELKLAIGDIDRVGNNITVGTVDNNHSTHNNRSYTGARLHKQVKFCNDASILHKPKISTPSSHSPVLSTPPVTKQSNSFSPTSVPNSCLDHQNGTHLIQILNSKLDPFYIYCVEDPQKVGDSWMVIQRRRNGKTNFFRNWDEYKRGFGNVEDEYFIGLDKLHALTLSSMHELWIQLEDFSNEKRWAKYSSFAIGDANDAYAINVLGSYTGNAGDSLTKHAGQKFSTKDVDNDSHPFVNCAIEVMGAWWYNDCLTSNLNGAYLTRDSEWSESGIGIDWQTWPQVFHSLKYVHMAIRPVKTSNE